MEQAEGGALSAFSGELADAVQRAAASLVTVYGRQRQPATGVAYAADVVLTADHVLERDEDLGIEAPDGRRIEARLAGRDPASDLAVLRVSGLNLPAATPAAVEPRVGQLALAVGRPSSRGHMASLGVVSAVGGPLRTGRGLTLDQYIRTDAVPYPGFSGGALVDVSGSVLGIVSTGLAGAAALAVPAAIAWRVAQMLASQGRIRRGYIGVSSQPVRLSTPRGTQETGLLIVQIHADSPALRAGLLVGDIIVGVEDHVVADTDDLMRVLTGDRVGQGVGFQIVRGGVEQRLEVTVGERAD
ncbi:MAG: S1C family serine protease [Chloroflexota bacterium]